MHKRPVWLKALAGVGEGFPESPHVNPMHADAVSLSRLFRPAVVQVSSNEHLSYNKISPDDAEGGECEMTEITTVPLPGEMVKEEEDLVETQLSS